MSQLDVMWEMDLDVDVDKSSKEERYPVQLSGPVPFLSVGF